MNQLTTAFQITAEDVAAVIEQQGRIATEAEVLDLFLELDHEAVAEAALYYDDMEDQTNSAYEEIAIQLRDSICELPKAF